MHRLEIADSEHHIRQLLDDIIAQVVPAKQQTSMLDDIIEGIVDPLTLSREELQQKLPFNAGILKVIHGSMAVLMFLWLTVLTGVLVHGTFKQSVDQTLLVHAILLIAVTGAMWLSICYFIRVLTAQFEQQHQHHKKDV